MEECKSLAALALASLFALGAGVARPAFAQAGAAQKSASPCRLNSAAAPPHRSAGKAQIKLSGAGLDVEAKDAPASCGAYWVQNQKLGPLEYKAGDGMVFETCVGEGLLQISNDEQKTTGKIDLAKGGRPVLITFNKAGGEAYGWSPASDKSGSVEIAPDLRSATGNFTVRNLSGAQAIKIDVNFNCRP